MNRKKTWCLNWENDGVTELLQNYIDRDIASLPLLQQRIAEKIGVKPSLMSLSRHVNAFKEKLNESSGPTNDASSGGEVVVDREVMIEREVEDPDQDQGCPDRFVKSEPGEGIPQTSRLIGPGEHRFQLSKRLSRTLLLISDECGLVRVYRCTGKYNNTSYYRCSNCDHFKNKTGDGLVPNLQVRNGQIIGNKYPSHNPLCRPITAIAAAAMELDRGARRSIRDGNLHPRQAYDSVLNEMRDLGEQQFQRGDYDHQYGSTTESNMGDSCSGPDPSGVRSSEENNGAFHDSSDIVRQLTSRLRAAEEKAERYRLENEELRAINDGIWDELEEYREALGTLHKEHQRRFEEMRRQPPPLRNERNGKHEVEVTACKTSCPEAGEQVMGCSQDCVPAEYQANQSVYHIPSKASSYHTATIYPTNPEKQYQNEIIQHYDETGMHETGIHENEGILHRQTGIISWESEDVKALFLSYLNGTTSSFADLQRRMEEELRIRVSQEALAQQLKLFQLRTKNTEKHPVEQHRGIKRRRIEELEEEASGSDNAVSDDVRLEMQRLLKPGEYRLQISDRLTDTTLAICNENNEIRLYRCYRRFSTPHGSSVAFYRCSFCGWSAGGESNEAPVIKMVDDVIRGERYPPHRVGCKPLTPAEALLQEFYSMSSRELVIEANSPKSIPMRDEVVERYGEDVVLQDNEELEMRPLFPSWNSLRRQYSRYQRMAKIGCQSTRGNQGSKRVKKADIQEET